MIPYICKECNNKCEALDIEEVVKFKKLCFTCRKNQIKKSISEALNINGVDCECPICKNNYKSFIHKDGTRKGEKVKYTCSEECRKEYEKRRRSKKIYEVSCDECKIKFESKTINKKYCSNECRSKGVKKAIFYKGLEQANQVILASKVKVYGANKEKMIGYINDKSRKEI